MRSSNGTKRSSAIGPWVFSKSDSGVALADQFSMAIHRRPSGSRAEGVSMGGIGMIESGRESGLAQEALDDRLVSAVLVVQHLDDGFACQEGLLGAIDRAEATLSDQLLDDEVAEGAPCERGRSCLRVRQDGVWREDLTKRRSY